MSNKYQKVANVAVSEMKRLELVRNFVYSLEQERIIIGLTQAQMAEKLEMSLSGYKKMISGGTVKIDLYMAYLMCELTGKLQLELCGGKLPELELVKKLRKLNRPQLQFIEGIVDFEIEFLQKEENPQDHISVLIPTGNLEDGMIWDSANVQKVNAAPYRQKFGDNLHLGIQVTSNHLHPIYNLGDILLICRKPPRDGDTGIFINKENGCAYIRKFHQTNPCLLEPLNDYGVAFKVDSNNVDDMAKWIKFGYVLTKMRN